MHWRKSMSFYSNGSILIGITSTSVLSHFGPWSVWTFNKDRSDQGPKWQIDLKDGSALTTSVLGTDLSIKRGTTISATNHIGHDHIGQKNIGHSQWQYRPHAVYTWCPDYKLISLLHQEAKVTNLKMKTLLKTKQQRLQKDKTTHMQHQLWKVWDEYRAGSRSVDGVLRACARICLSV